MVFLLFLIELCAFSEIDPDHNRDVVAGLAVVGLVFWCTSALANWSRTIPDRFSYCMVAGSITVMVEFIVFLNVPVRVWAIAPLVLFFSFWASFTVEYFIGIIYHPVEWYVKRALPETDPRGGLDNGQSQSGSQSAEFVPLTTVVWDGTDELESPVPNLPPDYDDDFSYTRKP